MTVTRFNRLCLAAGLAWLLAVPFGSMFIRPTVQDFPQYYMGGAIAARGAWDDLYPVPLPDSTHNPGFFEDSAMRPGYRKLALEIGGSENDVRFIQQPIVALLCAPLSWMNYPTANLWWRGLLAACAWVCSIYVVRGAALCIGRETKLAGIAALLCCVSPLAYRAVRVGNVSCIVALCIGVVIFDLVARARRRDEPLAESPDRARTRDPIASLILAAMPAAIALVLGSLLKYAPAALLPLHWFTRRFATPLVAGAVGLIALAATLVAAGPEPFRQFATTIAPTLNRSHPTAANQSLPGIVLRMSGQAQLSTPQQTVLTVAQFVALAVIGVLLLRVRRERWLEPGTIFAAGLTLIVWLLVFGPIFWEHYPVYFIPFVGWLIWESMQSRGRKFAVIAGAALLFTPAVIIAEKRAMPGFIYSHMLWGTLLLAAVAVGRLVNQTSTRQVESA